MGGIQMHAIDPIRRALRVATAALALLSAGAFTSPSVAQTEFKAGIADPVNTVLAWWMGQSGGFYAGQALKVEVIKMQGGSRGAAALQARRVDVMHVGRSSLIRLNRGGGDLRLSGSPPLVVAFPVFAAPAVQ